MKPVAIGRRNWLFAGSEGGGRTAAILFSLASTCKALKIDPFAYLRDVLNVAATTRPGGSRSCCPIAGNPSDAFRNPSRPDDDLRQRRRA